MTSRLEVVLTGLADRIGDVSACLDRVKQCNLCTSYKVMEAANSLEQQTEELIKILTRLNEQNKIKPRDWHEVEVLIDVARGNNVAEVLRRRLTQIYIASTRLWKEAQAFDCLPLEQQLGLPLVQQQVKIIHAPGSQINVRCGMEKSSTFWDAPVDLDESPSGPLASTPVLPDTTTQEDDPLLLSLGIGDETVENLWAVTGVSPPTNWLVVLEDSVASMVELPFRF